MAANAADFQVVFRNSRARARAALFRHIGLLESYFDGDIDLQGDLRGALRQAMAGGETKPNWLVALRNRVHEYVALTRQHASRPT